MTLSARGLRRRNNGGSHAGTSAHPTASASGLDQHLEQSRQAQRQADKWLISGSLLIGTAVLGIFGLPLFLRGVWLLPGRRVRD